MGDREGTRRRHGLLELGRGPRARSCRGQQVSSHEDRSRLCDLFPLARRVVREQAEALEHQLTRHAEPVEMTDLAGNALVRMAKDAAKALRRRCWRLLRAWKACAEPAHSLDRASQAVELEAVALARWAADQLGRMEPGEPARVPLLCALVLASWGSSRLPSIDARSIFSADGADTTWLGHRLADEIMDLARTQTLWELAVPRWQALQDLIWLARGVRTRPDFLASRDRRCFPWPPPLPWMDGLDGLRTMLESAPSDSRYRLGPNTVLPLRSLGDYQRYATTVQAEPELLDIHAIDHVTVGHLLTCIGVPRNLQRPIHKADLELLWTFASETARKRCVTGIARELRDCWVPMVRDDPQVHPGSYTRPRRWCQLLEIRGRPVLLELGPLVDELRLRTRGQLWKVEKQGSMGGPIAREVRVHVEGAAIARFPVAFVVGWPATDAAPFIQAYRREGVPLPLTVLASWREAPEGRWEHREGVPSVPAGPLDWRRTARRPVER
jgi:hypothetical protein